MCRNYPKYQWLANRIKDEQMAKLVELREKKKKPLTVLVAEAVEEYIKKHERR